MKTIKRTMAIATLLLAMSQSMWANTPYRNLYVSASSHPTGGGIIYLVTDDDNPYSPSVAGSSTELKATVGENGGNNFDCYINIKVQDNYTFLGVSETYHEDISDYVESDFIGTEDNSKLQDGYDKAIKVNIYAEGREGKDNDRDGVRDQAEGTGEYASWAFPATPDHTYYVVFAPNNALTDFYDYAYQKADYDEGTYNFKGQEPECGGTIGTLSCDKALVFDGDEVTLTATPKPGCHFVEWIDQENHHYTDNPFTTTISDQTRIIGYFGIDPITIGSMGISTYSCAKSIHFAEEERNDIKAYGATIEDGKVHLVEWGDGVPYNEGAILIGVSKTYNPEPEGITPQFYRRQSFNNNKLKNTAEDGIVADGTQYVLSNKNGEVGFYKVKSGKTIPQGKAYIAVAGSAKDFIGFSDDDNTTAIANMIEMRMDENQGFNLQGQRVDNNYRGIIVKNGKKYINK